MNENTSALRRRLDELHMRAIMDMEGEARGIHGERYFACKKCFKQMTVPADLHQVNCVCGASGFSDGAREMFVKLIGESWQLISGDLRRLEHISKITGAMES